MTKYHSVKIITLAVIFAWLFNVIAGRFLMAKISTWPLLNRWHILSPQAPIVINNRETVRVSDSGDVVSAADNIKSKISNVVVVDGATAKLLTPAINLSSDGAFVSQNVFTEKNGNYNVVLNDGRSAKITAEVIDSATGLAFFKVNINNVPAASLADSGSLKVGEKLLFVTGSWQNFLDTVQTTLVSSAQSDNAGQIFQSDYPRRSFNALPGPAEVSGQIVANTSAEIEGIYGGNSFISSSVLQKGINLFFANNQKINRPSFGFTYSIISYNESQLTGQNEGALVKDIAIGLPAKQAGFLSGDLIVSVDGKTVSENSPLEEMLENYKPADKANFSLLRKGQILSLTLIVGELK